MEKVKNLEGPIVQVGKAESSIFVSLDHGLYGPNQAAPVCSCHLHCILNYNMMAVGFGTRNICDGPYRDHPLLFDIECHPNKLSMLLRLLAMK